MLKSEKNWNDGRSESPSVPIHVRATVPSTAVRTTAASCAENLEQSQQSALGTRPVRVRG